MAAGATAGGRSRAWGLMVIPCSLLWSCKLSHKLGRSAGRVATFGLGCPAACRAPGAAQAHRCRPSSRRRSPLGAVGLPLSRRCHCPTHPRCLGAGARQERRKQSFLLQPRRRTPLTQTRMLRCHPLATVARPPSRSLAAGCRHRGGARIVCAAAPESGSSSSSSQPPSSRRRATSRAEPQQPELAALQLGQQPYSEASSSGNGSGNGSAGAAHASGAHGGTSAQQAPGSVVAAEPERGSWEDWTRYFYNMDDIVSAVQKGSVQEGVPMCRRVVATCLHLCVSSTALLPLPCC